MTAEDKLKLAQFIGTEDDGIPKDVAGHIQLTVEEQRRSRKVYPTKSWDFYQGDHENYFKQRKDEPTEVFNKRKEDAVKANYCKFIIDLNAKYAYGRPEKIRRQFTDNDVGKTENRMRHILEMVGIQTFMLEAKRKAGTFGEQPVRLIPLDENTGDQVRGRATPTSFPRPILLDPRQTYVLRTSWGKILGVVIYDEYRDYAKNKDIETMELIVGDSRWYWEDDALKRSEKNTYALEQEFVVFDNSDTKKDEIEPIVGLQIKLDEALTDANYFFSKHGWPQMVSSVDLQNVMYHPQYVWEVETDDGGKVLDKIGFLTWDGRMKEASEYRRELETYIFKIASVAPMATGDPDSIGHLRTGAALVAAHGPSIQSATEKQVAWEANEKALFHAIAKFDAKLHGQAFSTRFPEFHVTITFPNDFVPGEDLVRAEIRSMELNSHSTTIKDVLREKHPEFTEGQIDDMRKEIIEDSEEMVDSKRAFLTETSDQPVQSANKKSVEQKKT